MAWEAVLEPKDGALCGNTAQKKRTGTVPFAATPPCKNNGAPLAVAPAESERAAGTARAKVGNGDDIHICDLICLLSQNLG